MIHTPLRPVDRVVAVVSHLAHLLPAQGPIGVFIHQNTLHAFQHMPFEAAVCAAATTYGTEPFTTESAYREAMASGRIRPEDVLAVLNAEADGEIWNPTRRKIAPAAIEA